jgi:hypothetical protein
MNKGMQQNTDKLWYVLHNSWWRTLKYLRIPPANPINVSDIMEENMVATPKYHVTFPYSLLY